MPTWYVTFEVHRRGLLKQRARPRMTKTFETEAEAKLFAREKLDEGLIVFAGTLNPHSPKQFISSTDVSSWLENTQ
jgi:KaiC/GvpD/RAD55 family RecA-like ATPase